MMEQQQAPANPITIFYSYAHADERLRKQLENHLGLLRQQGIIAEWYDRRVVPGTDWAHEIDVHLTTAAVILLLISPDFLASDYCYGVELQRALQRHTAGEARVIPILLRPVADWDKAPFARLSVLPTNAKSITIWRNRDTAWADVVAGIRRAIEELPRLTVRAPRTTLPSVWNIPFPRNPVFTGREELLERLAKSLRTGQAIAISQPHAISGLGGIGKTQLAVEYAYRYHQDYQAVLWTRADTGESLVSGYVAIAEQLHLPEKDEQDQTLTVQAVLRWLKTHSEWLLILDNADDLFVVGKFLPSVFGGHILLTTRVQAMSRLALRIEVDTMERDVGTLFLLRRASLIPPDVSLEDAVADVATAREICEELGGLPLALDQAGAYIEETQCDLSQYLQRYQTHRVVLLKRRGGLVTDHPESIATTWSLSFEKVERQNRAAADLLRLCAFLSPDAIPLEIITEGAAYLGPALRPVAEDPLALDDALATLGTYSLLRRNATDNTLSVHRLVQVVLKETMNAAMQGNWAQHVVRAVNANFPEVEFATWQQCQRYLPHAQACALLIAHHQLFFPDAARLLNQAGSYLYFHAQYAAAEPLLKQALALREQVLGSGHLDTAISLNSLALLYRAQSKYPEAELLSLRVLEIRKQALDRLDPRVVNSLINLAIIYQIQGRYEQAEPLLKRALETSEQVAGPEHPLTVRCLTHIAWLYRIQSKYERAESLLKHALAIREQTLGPWHPDLANVLNSLGLLYQMWGKYSDAEPLLKSALMIREQVLGSLHPHTASSLNILGEVYQAQGKYEQAEQLMEQALAIREQRLGSEHPYIAISLNTLGEVYQAQGKYEQAEQLMKRALAIDEKVMGSTHLETGQTLNNLAALYQEQEKCGQAEPLFQRALHIFEQTLGPEHPQVAFPLNGLAILYREQGKYEQAEPLLQRALTIRQQQRGAQHPETAETLHDLARFHELRNQSDKALALYQQALAIREERLGPEHPHTVETRTRYAHLRRACGCSEEAAVLEAVPTQQATTTDQQPP